MNSLKIENLFIAILKEEITGVSFSFPLSEISSMDMQKLYQLSQKQSLAQIVYANLKRKEVSIPSELQVLYDKTEKVAVHRCVLMDYDIERLGEYFNDLKIPYILLKGSVLRAYYPQDYMRTSNDIDVLIREEDIEKALTILKEKEYTVLERTYHDISVITPSRIHLELHFSPLFLDEQQNDVLKGAWTNSLVKEGYRYAFTDEFFLFYFFSHMATHFISSGCGVRFLTDLWVISNRMMIPLTCADEMLKKAGIYKFAQEMIKLMHICFDGMAEAEGSRTILLYMLTGGACGCSDNYIVARMSQGKKYSRFRFMMGRLFPRYKLMKEVYPVLRKVPILLPIFWVVRLFAKLKLGKGKSAVMEIKAAKFVSTDEVKSRQQMFKNLGLIE